jgi:hypothetical protein
VTHRQSLAYAWLTLAAGGFPEDKDATISSEAEEMK